MQMNRDVVRWVTANVLPLEAELRGILRKACTSSAEVDDVIQETYCKLLDMARVDHIEQPRAFLIRTARNIVTDRRRRDAVVHIEAVADLENVFSVSAAPSAEDVASARAELNWIVGLIAKLPERCRAVFSARRIDGLSQNETAESLKMSVGMVEQETVKGMELLSEMIARVGVRGDAARMPVRKRKTTKARNDVNHR